MSSKFSFGTPSRRAAATPIANTKNTATPAAVPAPSAPAVPAKRMGFSFSGGQSASDMGIPDFASSSHDSYEEQEFAQEQAPPSAPVRTAAAKPGIPVARPAIVPPSSPSRAAAPSSAPGGIPAPSGVRFAFGAPSLTPTERAAQAAKQQAPDELSGLLTDVRMYNDWGIGKVQDDQGRKVSVKGAALADLEVGQRYKFVGRKSEHPKYGAQFEIVRAQPDIESVDAIVAHIQRNYKGAGLQTATKLAQFHRSAGTLDELKQALIHAPGSIDFSPFTDRAVVLRDDEDSRVRRVRDMLSIRLGGLGVGQQVIAGLAGYLVQEAAKTSNKERFPNMDLVSMCSHILDDNPFEPIREVERYGFQTADLVARQAGIGRDDPKRISAIVSYALSEGCEAGGHVWLSQGALFESITRIDYLINPSQAVSIAIERGEPIVIDEEFGAPRYYTKAMRRAEQLLASHLAMRLTHEVEPLYQGDPAELDAVIDQAVRAVGGRKGIKDYKLDPSQRAAIVGILTSTCSLHTLTAGPGCGKTTIVEVLMEALDGTDAIFCAPTGKAAKVLNGRVKSWGEAKTIHSTLEFVGEFQRNASNPLDTELVVGDEQSMLDTSLGAHFFDAIPARSHIIMLGDINQLGPIGPGAVLRAVLELEGFDHHRLTTTHRNDGELLAVINEVGDGFCDGVSRGQVEFTGSLPAPTAGVFAYLAQEIKEAAHEYGGLARVGVICPKRKGTVSKPDWNVTYLNAVLRDALNPDDETQSKKIPGTSFRMGDRIIITKNMMIEGENEPSVKPVEAEQTQQSDPDFDAWLDGVVQSSTQVEDNPFEYDVRDQADGESKKSQYVVNGDTGAIVGVQFDETERSYKKLKHLVLQLDDDRTVHFPAGELESLGLSYAITVHAAQGSEYGKVFAIVTDGHEQFMYRSMMFTEFSRSQTELKVYGEPDVLTKVAARPAPQRNCALVQQTLREAGELMGERVVPEQKPRQREVA